MSDVTMPQTKLDAVNLILWSIGETPVNTLEVTGIRDVALAQEAIDRVTREVLTEGWDFNTDENWELVPNDDGHIVIPTNALRVVPMDRTKRLVVRRNNDQRVFWDKDRHTFVFEAPVKVEIVWGMEFEDLPEAARNYISTRAARQFQAGAMGSELLYRFTAQHELEARTAFRRDHALVKRANLLAKDPIYQRFRRR